MLEVQTALTCMTDLDVELEKISSSVSSSELSKVQQIVAYTRLIEDITGGCGKYATLPHEVRIALAFYTMGYSKAKK